MQNGIRHTLKRLVAVVIVNINDCYTIFTMTRVYFNVCNNLQFSQKVIILAVIGYVTITQHLNQLFEFALRCIKMVFRR